MSSDIQKIEQNALFSNLKANDVAWLGFANDPKRIECDFSERKSNGGMPFLVRNGAWCGTLHREDGGVLYIIDERGTRHHDVRIAEVRERILDESSVDDIPY